MSTKNSEYWEDRIAKETWRTYNDIEEKNIDLIKMYDKTSQNIKKELYALAERAEETGSLTRSEQYRFNKLLGQQGHIYREIEKLGEQVENHAKKQMFDGGKRVYGNIMDSLGVENYDYPNKKQMEQMLRRPWKGSFFSERLWKENGKLEKNLNGIIKEGMATGKTVTEMAVQLSNIMQKSFNDAHRLIRSETVTYLNRSAVDGYKDAGVKKVQWWAAEDERMCDICGAMHGKEYPVNDVPLTPHPNCRCTQIPVVETDSKEEYNKSEEDYVFTSDVGKKLAKSGIEYNAVVKHRSKISTGEIIQNVGGGDLTTGSCASLAFAYAGNKGGLDVLDFRGGKSQHFFSLPSNINSIAKLEGVNAYFEKGYNDVKNAVKLLKGMEKDKEFILSTGRHMAVVKHTDEGFSFLELQSKDHNGFKELTTNTLRSRFRCAKSKRFAGIKLELESCLIDVDTLSKNEEFKHILGYINTKEEKQMKGVEGYVK